MLIYEKGPSLEGRCEMLGYHNQSSTRLEWGCGLYPAHTFLTPLKASHTFALVLLLFFSLPPPPCETEETPALKEAGQGEEGYRVLLLPMPTRRKVLVMVVVWGWGEL